MIYNRNYLKYSTDMNLPSLFIWSFNFLSPFSHYEASLWAPQPLTSSHSSLSISDYADYLRLIFRQQSFKSNVHKNNLVLSFRIREIDLLFFLPTFYAVFSNPFLKLIKCRFLTFFWHIHVFLDYSLVCFPVQWLNCHINYCS